VVASARRIGREWTLRSHNADSGRRSNASLAVNVLINIFMWFICSETTSEQV
jgi:hypothetical protein